MSKLSLPQGPADVLFGIPATAVFLTLMFGTSVGIVPSLLLAAATYVGLRLWLTPEKPREAPEPPEVSSQDLLAQIRTLRTSVRDPEIAKKITDICTKAEHVLAYFQTKPETERLFGVNMRLWLESTRDSVDKYASLAKFYDQPNAQLNETCEKLLDLVMGSMDALYKKLLAEDVENYAQLLDAQSQTIKDVSDTIQQLGGTVR